MRDISGNLLHQRPSSSRFVSNFHVHVTDVHPLQIVDRFPTDAHDLPLSLITTPDETIRVDDPPPPPRGIDWSALSEDALDEMPILRDLQSRMD